MDKIHSLTKPFCYLLCLQHKDCLAASFYQKLCSLFAKIFNNPQNVIQSNIVSQSPDINKQAHSSLRTFNRKFCFVNQTLDAENPICGFNSRFGYLHWSGWSPIVYEPCSNSQLIWAFSRRKHTAYCNGGQWLEIYSKDPFFVNVAINNYTEALNFCTNLDFDSLFTGFYRILGTEWSSRTEPSDYYWSGFLQNKTTKEVHDRPRRQVTIRNETYNKDQLNYH